MNVDEARDLQANEDSSRAAPILMRRPDIVALKTAVDRTGKSERTIRSTWEPSYFRKKARDLAGLKSDKRGLPKTSTSTQP